MLDKNKWKERAIIMLVLFLMMFSFFYGFGFGYNNKEFERKSDCFYSSSLGWECRNSGGQLNPLIENDTKYWICTNRDYKVKAC